MLKYYLVGGKLTVSNQNSSGGGYTASAHCKPDYNLAHNARVPGSVYDQEHIGVGEHEHWIGGNELSPEKLFNAVFEEAVEKFNENQKRSDRKIKSYYQRVLADGRFGKKKTLKFGNKDKIVDISRKPIYEFILQIGNRDEHPEGEKIKEIFKSFIFEVWAKKFGRNFRIVRADYHDDEYSEDKNGEYTIKSPAHVHLDFVPVVEKKPEELQGKGVLKLELQHSLSQACEQAGFQTDHLSEEERKIKIELKRKIKEAKEKGDKDLKEQLQMQLLNFSTMTNQQRFEESVRFAFAEHCEKNGIKIDLTPRKKHSHMSKELFKIRKESEKLEQEKEIHAEQKKDFEKKEEEFEQYVEKFKKEVESLKQRENEINRRELDQADLIQKEKEIAEFLKENKVDRPDFNFKIEVPELLPAEDGLVFGENREKYAQRNLLNFKKIVDETIKKAKNNFSNLIDCVKTLWDKNKKLRKENKNLKENLKNEIEKATLNLKKENEELKKENKKLKETISFEPKNLIENYKKGLVQQVAELKKIVENWQNKSPNELREIADKREKPGRKI